MVESFRRRMTTTARNSRRTIRRFKMRSRTSCRTQRACVQPRQNAQSPARPSPAPRGSHRLWLIRQINVLTEFMYSTMRPRLNDSTSTIASTTFHTLLKYDHPNAMTRNMTSSIIMLSMTKSQTWRIESAEPGAGVKGSGSKNTVTTTGAGARFLTVFEIPITLSPLNGSPYHWWPSTSRVAGTRSLLHFQIAVKLRRPKAPSRSCS